MKRVSKIIVILLIITGGIILALLFDLPTILGTVVQRIQSTGIIAPVLFTLLYVLTAVCLLPGSILTLTAGYVFGLRDGIILISIASTLGAFVAFLISRYLLRNWIEKKLSTHRSLHAIDMAVQEKGWVIVALMRLSPLVPYNLANYLFGLTGIRILPYVLASWIAMLPGTATYVWIGSLAENLSSASNRQERSTLEWILFTAGLFATLGVTIYVSSVSKKMIRKYVDSDHL